MFRILGLLSFTLTMLQYVCAQQYGSFKDSRDAKVYKTVKIGNQVWMAENLNTDRFRNGDLIPEVKTEADWEKADINKKPAWCYYNNNFLIGKTYGKLYNLWAIIDSRGLAPNGFNIPSKEEWDSLDHEIFSNPRFESSREAGGGAVGSYLKSSEHWLAAPPSKFGNPFGFDLGGIGNNSSGFTAQPGGYRSYGRFIYFEKSGVWWTSTKGIYKGVTSKNEEEGWYAAELNYYDHSLQMATFRIGGMLGISLRCVREIDSTERAEITQDLKRLREQDTLNRLASFQKLLDEPISLDKIKVAKDDFPERMKWDEAIIWSKKIGNGWRLPRAKELIMFLKSDIDKNVRNDYWTSKVTNSSSESVIAAISKFRPGINQEENWEFISTTKDKLYSVRLIWSQLSNKQLDSLDNIEDSLKLVSETKMKEDFYKKFKLKLDNEAVEIKNLIISKFDLPTEMTYEEADVFCKMIGSEWRLPSKKELSDIYSNRYKIGEFKDGKGIIRNELYYLGFENGVVFSSDFKNYGELSLNHGWRNIGTNSPVFRVRLVKSKL